jgi:hypothetical protein
MPNEQHNYEEILQGIEELKKKKPKDRWDKAATIGQLVSGVFLVIVGMIITSSINSAQRESARQITEEQIRSAKQITELQISSSKDINKAQSQAASDTVQAQNKNSTDIQNAQAQTSQRIQQAQSATAAEIQKAQAATSTTINTAQSRTSKEIAAANLDATNRNIASEYVKNWTSAKTAEERVTLLNALDAAVEAERAVPLAINFSRLGELRANICNGGEVHDNRADFLRQLAVSHADSELLQRLKNRNASQFQQISTSKNEPDASVAKDALSDHGGVFFRLSEIDDKVTVQVSSPRDNAVILKAVGEYTFGHAYDWKELTPYLEPDRYNDLNFIVSNGLYEGTGVRIQLRVGTQQYDALILRQDWTSSGPAFQLNLRITPDALGRPSLVEANVQALPVASIAPKPCPAEATRAVVAVR